MRRIFMAPIIAIVAVITLVGGASAATALTLSSGNSDVCSGLDSGKIDVKDGTESVTVTAPEGKLIDAYCVKAGSTDGGTGGPVSIDVDPPEQTVVITYPTGKDISHYSVSYTDRVKPDKPADKVVYGDWTDGDKNCETRKVTQTRTKSVTTYTWDPTKWEWVASDPVITTETQTRPMTANEIKVCAGDKPDDKVVTTEWVDGDKSCESKTVTQSRTVTTTPYVYDASTGTYVLGTPVVKTETQTRPMTAAEIEACDTTTPPESCPNLTGSVKTTDKDGNIVNGNTKYENKADVYVYGSQLPDDLTKVFIRVTDPSGNTVLSAVKEVTVIDGTFGPVQLPEFSDTPNQGGEYKVQVSTSLNFEGKCTKSDNFKVKDKVTPPPVKEYTTSWPATDCVPGLDNGAFNNKVVGEPVVTPAGAASVASSINGNILTYTTTPNEGYAPKSPADAVKVYTDNGSGCAPEPPVGTPEVKVTYTKVDCKTSIVSVTFTNIGDLAVYTALLSDRDPYLEDYNEGELKPGSSVTLKSEPLALGETVNFQAAWVVAGNEDDSMESVDFTAERPKVCTTPTTPPVVNPPPATPPVPTKPTVGTPQRPVIINTDGGQLDSNNRIALIGGSLMALIALGGASIAMARSRV